MRDSVIGGERRKDASILPLLILQIYYRGIRETHSVLWLTQVNFSGSITVTTTPKGLWTGVPPPWRLSTPLGQPARKWLRVFENSVQKPEKVYSLYNHIAYTIRYIFATWDWTVINGWHISVQINTSRPMEMYTCTHMRASVRVYVCITHMLFGPPKNQTWGIHNTLSTLLKDMNNGYHT